MPSLYCTSCQEICEFIDSDEIESSTDGIDNFIYGLAYSCDQVLIHKRGSKYSVQLMKECQVDDEKNFIVITRERRTAENGTSDIGAVTSNEHRTFPGELKTFLANERLVDNMPDVLAVDRAPLTYTINLPGLKEKSSFTINHPSFGEYFKSKEKVLETWFDEYQNTDNIIANLQSELSFAYSKELLRINFGLGFAETKIEHSIDFSSMANNERLIVIYIFKKVFYMVSVEPTKKPSDLFASGITVEELQRKTNSDNPPVMVDRVSYGRVIDYRLGPVAWSCNPATWRSRIVDDYECESVDAILTSVD